MQQKRKNMIFKVIAVLLPVLLLIILEFGLKLIHYGNDLSLFLDDPQHLGFVYNNPDVSKKYFINEQDAASPYLQIFQKRKASNTFRIFVLGESSAVGFPYDHNGSFARQLEYRLDRTFPDENIEIINLSVTAICSYTLLDFTDEVIQMNPDAVLIYTGHNEYYGVLGVGSAMKFSSSQSLIKVAVYLKKYRTVQLMSNLYTGIQGLFVSKTIKGDFGRMKNMAEEQNITLGSPIYLRGLGQFERNMDELLSKYNHHNIPVFFSNIVSNVKDQKPFVSKLNEKTDSLKFMQEYDSGLKAYANNDFDLALTRFQAAQRIDSTYAKNSFYLGDIFYKKNDFDKADLYFEKAVDLDALRFRAPAAINNIIRSLCAKFNNVRFVDSKMKFKANSPHGILDNSLFVDHLHPNLPGYFMISDAFYDALKSNQLIGKWNHYIPSDSIRMQMPLTAVDTIFGNLVVMYLKESWPFYEPIDLKKVKKHTYAEKLAAGIIFQNVSWETALDSLYRYHRITQNDKEAVRVTKALALEHPYDAGLAFNVGQECFRINDLNEAVFYYKKAFAIAPAVDIARSVSGALMKLDQLEEAKRFIQYVKQNDASDKACDRMLNRIDQILHIRLILENDPKNVKAIQVLAQFYLNLGNMEMAKRYIDSALSLDPKNAQSLELMTSYTHSIDKISKK